MRRSGYQHPDYAKSLSCFGEPVYLPLSEGWILRRSIPESSYNDAMGLYPLFICRDWAYLKQDLKAMEDEWIALSMVADPLARLELRNLAECFPDKCIPFKRHYIIDLTKSPQSFVSHHHQRYMRKALKKITVDLCERPHDYLMAWMQLYDVLIQRHGIQGLTRFSRNIFSRQLKVPGIRVFKAELEGRIVGMQIWYATGDKAYYHLGACNQDGYSHHAAFALFWKVIEYFQHDQVKWLCLGSGAGTQSDPADGLARFKKGWANETRIAYFCGVVNRSDVYNRLIRIKAATATNYFPAYRNGEFS